MTDKDEFWQLLAHYPDLERYWDTTGTGELRDTARKDILRMRPRDATLLGILASIWLGGLARLKENDCFRVDLTDIPAYIDRCDLKPILDWLIDPYWP